MSADQVTVVTLNNPFDPNERRLRQLDWQEGATLADYAPETVALPGVEWVWSINGRLVRDGEPATICPGDFLACCPVLHGGDSGKNVARIVAMVALSFAAPWAAGALNGASFMGGTLYMSALGQTLAAAAIFTAGAMTIGAVLPAATQDTSKLGRDAWNESPTYGWGTPKVTTGQGRPLPLLFGTMRVGGHIFNTWVESVDSDQYLHVLLGVCDGQHNHISLNDLWINGQPAANFHGVTADARPGAVDDTVLAGFDRLRTQHEHNILLEYGVHQYVTTEGTEVDAVEVDILAPYGIFATNTDGGLVPRSATWDICYRVHGTADWSSPVGTNMTLASTKAGRRTVAITGLAPNQYDLRIVRTNTESTDLNEKSTIYLSATREIVSRSLTYPGVAKYAVRVLATDQLSGGMPAFSMLAGRDQVYVWNPHTEESELESARNPAWAYYALLNTHHNIAPDRLLYDEIAAWASYCDQTVDGAPRFALDLYLDSEEDLWSSALKVCQIGRAIPIRRGSKYGVVADMPTSVTQLFTTGNIVAGSFSLDYLPQTDRANAVEVTYMDAARDYSRQVISVLTDEYNKADTPDNRASLRLMGCTSRAQAIRHAAFLLNCNRLILRTISFQADIDAIAAQVGDLIYFSHDAPDWGISGRIVSATTTTITLDQPVTRSAGASYALLLRMADDTLLDCPLAVAGQTTTSATVPLATPLAVGDVPALHDLYAFGPVASYKRPYRVTSISRAGELTKRIMAVEYNSAIYSDTGYVIDAPATTSPLAPGTVVAVYLSEVLAWAADGTYVSTLEVTWSATVAATLAAYEVWIKDDNSGQGYLLAGSSVTGSLTIPSGYLNNGHDYTVLVAFAGAGPIVSDANTATITILGVARPPANVTGFAGTYKPLQKAIVLSWTANSEIDLAGYEVRQGGSAWGVGDTLVKTDITGVSLTCDVSEVAAGTTITYRIKAGDRSGNNSTTAASCSVQVTSASTEVYDTPSTPAGLTVTGAFSTILLSWTRPTYRGHKLTQIWRHTSNNLAAASMVGEAIDAFYTDTPPNKLAATTYYYWIRFVNLGDQTGPFNAANGAGTSGHTASDPAYVMDILLGQLGYSQFSSGVFPILVKTSLPTLPDNAYPAGAHVFLTTDQLLYRSTGSAWTAEVPAAVADGSITTGKLAANSVTAGKIATGAIVAGDGVIANAAIANAHIIDGTIAAAKIGSCSADAITTGSMSAARITSGTMSGERIDSSSIITATLRTGTSGYTHFGTYVSGGNTYHGVWFNAVANHNAIFHLGSAQYLRIGTSDGGPVTSSPYSIDAPGCGIAIESGNSYNRIYGETRLTGYFYPRAAGEYGIGSSGQWWGYGYFNALYWKSTGTHTTFDTFDDLALIDQFAARLDQDGKKKVAKHGLGYEIERASIPHAVTNRHQILADLRRERRHELVTRLGTHRQLANDPITMNHPQWLSDREVLAMEEEIAELDAMAEPTIDDYHAAIASGVFPVSSQVQTPATVAEGMEFVSVNAMIALAQGGVRQLNKETTSLVENLNAIIEGLTARVAALERVGKPKK